MTAGLLPTFRAVLERVERLERRVADLEARRSLGPRRPEPLERCNARRAAEGARLRKAIRDLLTAHPGPREMTGKQVRAALERRGWAPLPSVRAVQWHLRALRGGGDAARATRNTAHGVREG